MTDELILRINPTNGSITVEDALNGTISHKCIAIDSLYDCIKSSLQREFVASGLLPQNCISFTAGSEDFRSITIMHAEDYADISYYNTVYEHFPLPKLLFKFKSDDDSSVAVCDVLVNAPTGEFTFPGILAYSKSTMTYIQISFEHCEVDITKEMLDDIAESINLSRVTVKAGHTYQNR